MTNFLQLLFAGFALGALYALVALGFVVIYKATGVINFAQGGLVLLGGYLTYNAHHTWGLPFVLAVPIAMIICGLVGAATERFALRRMIGQPPFAVIMLTIGLLIVMEQVVTIIWGFNPLNMGDPWGIHTVSFGGVVLSDKDVATIVFAAVALVIFYIFFRYSRYGLAMRATAFDQEAAVSLGISARRVFGLSWVIAAAVGTIAGVMLASGAGAVQSGLDQVALLAFPAIILGGLDSTGGAIVGGVVIGVSQNLTAGYQHQYASWLGGGFNSVMPYAVMIIILLVKPYGLFGTREVRRV